MVSGGDSARKVVEDLWIHDPREGSADGRLRIPVGRIGDGGRTVLILGGVHGDESVGPIALRSIFQKLDPDAIDGTVLVVPSANLPAERTLQRFGLDGLNMNREFPGDPGGSLTQRICATLATDLAAGADVIVDVHSGGRSLRYAPGAAIRLSGDQGLDAASWRLARALSLPFVYCSHFGSHRPSHSSAMAADLGIPAVAMEVGGSEAIRPADIDRVVRSLTDLLSSEGLLIGPARQHRPSTNLLLRDDLTVRAPASGYFVPTASLGTVVDATTSIGHFVDLDELDRVPADVTAAEPGRIVALRTVARCAEGDALVHLATDLKFDHSSEG